MNAKEFVPSRFPARSKPQANGYSRVPGLWSHLFKISNIAESVPLSRIGTEYIDGKSHQRMRVAVDVPSFIEGIIRIMKNKIDIGQKNVVVANDLLDLAMNIRKAGKQPMFIFDSSAPSSAANTDGTGDETEDGDERIDHQRIANLTKERLEKEGLSFCDAPGKAVAECAALQSAGRVDAVMSNNSDVFLFGGKHVLYHEKTLDGVVMVKELKEEDLRSARPDIFSIPNCFLAINILSIGVESCGPAIAFDIGASSYGHQLAAIVNSNQWDCIDEWKKNLLQDFKAKYPNIAQSLPTTETLPKQAAIHLYKEERKRRGQDKTGHGRQTSDPLRPALDETSGNPVNPCNSVRPVKPVKRASLASPANSKGGKRQRFQDKTDQNHRISDYLRPVLGETSANSANSANTVESSSVPKPTRPEPVKSTKRDYTPWLIDRVDLENPRKRRSKTSSQ
ncbi:hypothetical protein PG991_015339 [Apiospora marii]|uniref:XPG-I domain-containing protein n=1 Tax=Apiospora marii TaxID=335849 RepID=A0ABR1R1E9_9PEZI